MGGRARGRGAGGRGGAGRGLGRKTSSATSAPRPAAPDATSTKKQMTLATLLGPRHEASALTPRRPAVLATDVIKWRSGEDGEKADTSKNLSVDELLNKLTYGKNLLSST